MIRHPVLEQLASHGVKMGLDRVRSLLSHLGEPHLAYPTVHVAGTNGKGSTCMMVTAALVEAGYRVGTNISPHLEQVNERICVNGVPVDDATFSEFVEILDRHRMDWARSIAVDTAPLTYFEFITVMALLVFAARGVHVGVIETGLGGRLDATNVVKPVVTAITTVGL
ncbi:MAG: dihydrofolate synthase/folylpolyglutamate synthase, partial [Kiritimatiellia bacterium]